MPDVSLPGWLSSLAVALIAAAISAVMTNRLTIKNEDRKRRTDYLMGLIADANDFKERCLTVAHLTKDGAKLDGTDVPWIAFNQAVGVLRSRAQLASHLFPTNGLLVSAIQNLHNVRFANHGLGWVEMFDIIEKATHVAVNEADKQLKIEGCDSGTCAC
jgi:hypothetical protein